MKEDASGEARGNPATFGIGRLFWAVSEGIVVGDMSTEAIALWNPAAEELFGWSSDEAVGMPLHHLVPRELREAHLNGLARYRETGRGDLVGSRSGVELPALRKDGSVIQIELTLSRLDPLDDPDKDYVLALIRDVTDRKKAETLRIELHDAEIRKAQAFHLNDSVVQQLALAKLALEIGDTKKAQDALSAGLTTAKALISEAIGDAELAVLREKSADGDTPGAPP